MGSRNLDLVLPWTLYQKNFNGKPLSCEGLKIAVISRGIFKQGDNLVKKVQVEIESKKRHRQQLELGY